MSNDIEAIRRLTHEMQWAWDRACNIDPMSLWADSDDLVFDQTGIGSNRVEGRAAVAAFLAGKVQNPDPAKRVNKMHLLGNHVIDVDGDQATGKCAMYAWGHMPDGSYSDMGCAYDDEYVRGVNGWRFKSRAISWLIPRVR